MENGLNQLGMYREMHLRAHQFYKEQLRKSEKAINYLKERGVSGETALEFGIGYAPDNRQALKEVFPNYRVQSLVDCGLVAVNDNGHRYDRFRDRIMFPIHDEADSVIGFGSRVIDSGFAKYLNSPETPLFKKGSLLYGFSKALPIIHETQTAFVVEGYMDVAMLAQHGIKNVVAALGTATTANHITLLKREAKKIVFCFDGDEAGRTAAMRTLDLALPHACSNTKVSFMFLPHDHDPDSFVRERGAQAFLSLSSSAIPIGAYLMRKLREAREVSSCEGRAGFVHDALPYLRKIIDPLLRNQTVREVARFGRMSTDEIMSFM